jgi:hypothetical protein
VMFAHPPQADNTNFYTSHCIILISIDHYEQVLWKRLKLA